MNLSKSSKLDFMIVNFATSLLKVSKVDAKDEGVKDRSNNKDYQINKRIDRRIDTIQTMLDEVVADMYNLGGNDLATWTKKNLPKRIGGTLTKIQEHTVNLEYLAMFILYVNFAENEREGKALSEPMQMIQQKMDYILETTALFEQINISFLEGAMYEQSIKIIQMIKW